MDGFQDLKVTDEALEKRLAAIYAPGEGEYEPQAALERFRARPSVGQISPKHLVPGWLRGADAERRISSFGAGALAIIAFIAVVGVQQLSRIKSPSGAVSSTKLYKTLPGQRATLALASGIQATLAPATTLSVTDGIVSLSGEAVFTVVHKSDVPFVVKTQATTVNVLGTTFSVREYDGDEKARVIVAEGRVSVNNTVLSTGDVAHASITTGTSVQHGVDIASALSWTSGRITFNKMTFAQVIPDIERWYNVKIRLTDPSLGNKRLTTSLKSGYLSEAIELISAAIKARSEQSGNTIIFIPQR